MKTTIDVPSSLWKDFTLKVIEKEGMRKNNQVIVSLITQYVRKKK